MNITGILSDSHRRTGQDFLLSSIFAEPISVIAVVGKLIFKVLLVFGETYSELCQTSAIFLFAL